MAFDIIRLFDNTDVESQHLARNIQSEVVSHKYTTTRNTTIERELMHEDNTQNLSTFDVEKRKVERGEEGVFKFKRIPTIFDDSEVLYIMYLLRTSSRQADCQIIKQVQGGDPALLDTIHIPFTNELVKKDLKDILLKYDGESVIMTENLKSIA